MLTVLLAKPILLVIVSAEPTSTGGAFCAFSAENWGESPDTVKPQSNKKVRKTGVGVRKNSGDNKQHKPEMASWALATRLPPINFTR